MNRTIEDRIQAYLDGQMSSEAQRAFLAEAAHDPRIQHLLDEHRQLNALLRDRRRPIAVPLATQRALAEKLPALQAALPASTLAPAATSGGLLGNALRRGGALLSAVGWRRVWISAVAASLLLTGSYVLYNSLDGRTVDTVAETSQESAGIETETTTSAPGTSSSSIETEASSGTVSNGASARDERRARSAVGSRGTKSATAVERGSAFPDAGSAGENIVQFSGIELAALAHELEAAERGTGVRAEPVMLRGPMQARIPGMDRMRLYVESGSGWNDVRGNASSKSSVEGVYLIGLRYDLSSSFALGLEYAQSRFNREGITSERQRAQNGSATEYIVIGPGMVAETLPWLRLHGAYTLNPEDVLQLQADLGGGVLLTQSRPFVFSLGLTTVLRLSPLLNVRGGVHYRGALLEPFVGTPADIPTSGGAIGIIRNAGEPGRAYTSTVEFRVGFGLGLW